MSAQTRAEVYKEFPLLTGGDDKELDALNICILLLRELTEDERKRAMTYLFQRFNLTVL
jgi:hypothetical protein